ncbi:MAG: conditioned medium factor [Acidobacteria bacterium]|nr:conditioned medium factor [Acidobacteriota bacterium]
MKRIVLLGVFAASTTSLMARDEAYKVITGPGRELVDGTRSEPVPTANAQRSDYVRIAVERLPFSRDIVVSGGAPLRLAAVSGEGIDWDVTLRDPQGRARSSAEAKEMRGTEGQVVGRTYLIESPAAGVWNLRIEGEAGLSGASVFVSTGNKNLLVTHFTSYDFLLGRTVGLRAFASVDGRTPDPHAVLDLRATIRDQESATQTAVPLYDDGSHGDLDAGDGIYGCQFRPARAGFFTVETTASGFTGDGTVFERSAAQVFPIVKPLATIVSARAENVDANADGAADGTVDTVLLRARVQAESDFDAGSLELRCDLYGLGSEIGVPVAWSQRMFDIGPGETRDVELEVDARYVSLAGVTGGFDLELRNLRIVDPATHVIVARRDRIALDLPRAAYRAFEGDAAALPPEMLMGENPAAAKAAGGPVLMLVHGYCSGLVWPTSDFSNYIVFQDLKQNRTHDQFARLIQSFGANNSSFGVVAHSQGGCASLHLYTYYWSGLDYATGSRLIQSVGTPYQGTSLAGNLALLGQIFGVGCGTNWDLTYDGASLWLAGIPTWARAKVNYSTTSFTDVWYRYDYCNIASDLVLSDPEDGTTEKSKGQLSGAVNRGHKTGWCHTTGMRDPAQYQDHSRNAQMSSYAAR